MSVDFRPILDGYSTIRPFRFWCQKVIPLVYDDSLSYYELLGKVVDYLNHVIEDLGVTEGNVRKLLDAFVALQDYVNEFTESEEFENLVDEKVREIFGTRLDDIEEEIKNVDFLMPREEEMNEYKEDMLKVLDSYLRVNPRGTYYEDGYSVVDTDPKIVYDYSTDYGYLRMYAEPTTQKFIMDATREVSGVTRHVAYVDCATFMSLVRKGIMYANSPYYKAFTDEEYSNIYNSGLLDYNSTTKPYLTDAYNDVQSYRDAFIEHQSGNHLKLISVKAPSVPVNLYTDNLAELETGDIIWIGSEKFPNRFNGIHHVGMYIKDIEELNAISTLKYKAGDSGSTEYGYVVSVGTHDDGVLAINTLDFWTKYMNDTTYTERCYYTKGWSNDLVDSRYQYATEHKTDEGVISRYYADMDSGMTSNTITINRKTGDIDTFSVSSKGLDLYAWYGANIDFDDFRFNGHFTNRTQLTSVSHGPAELDSMTIPFELKCFGFSTEGDKGVQQLTLLGAARNREDLVFTRSYNSERLDQSPERPAWSGWVCNIQGSRKEISIGSIAANSTKYTTVEFNEMGGNPFVQATVRLASTFNPEGSQFTGVTCMVANVTRTTATLYLHNFSSVAVTCWVDFLAYR